VTGLTSRLTIVAPRSLRSLRAPQVDGDIRRPTPEEESADA
jgi:hypothetical protein